MAARAKTLMSKKGASWPKTKKGRRTPLVRKEEVAIFGETIRMRISERFGLNLSLAARELGIGRTMLLRIEEGKLLPRADIFLHLCASLGIDPRTAFANEQSQTPRTLPPKIEKLRPVRIVAEPKEPREERLTFDAIINKDGKIAGNHAVLGLWGRFDRDDDFYSPFVLTSKGEILYDSNLSEEERYWLCDLREGEIKRGRRFTYSRASYVVQYEIVSVTAMPVVGSK